MKLEIQILILFLLSIVALVFHHFVPRTMDVDYRGEQWKFSNTYSGAGTFANSQITDRGAETRMKVAKDGGLTFCASVFTPSEPCDLSWFSEVSFTGYIEGSSDSECFRLYLRNIIPEVYDADQDQSLQYNEVPLKITSKRQKFVLDRAQFNVPSWWAEKDMAHFDHSMPKFDSVKRVEIVTGSTVSRGDMKLLVDNIEFRGHWIPPMVLYRSLLAAWMVLATGVVLQKLLDIQAALKLSNEQALRLTKINNWLETKATELSKLAHHDNLTGLMNRHGILQYTKLVGETVGRGERVSLIVLDIDNFKKLNDTQGHVYADKVLSHIGQLLSATASDMDLFARWGGEEFIAICFGKGCLLYTSPSPRDRTRSRMPSSA